MIEIEVTNRQRSRRVDARHFRRIVEVLVRDLLGLDTARVGIRLVGRAAMAEANAKYLGHEGSTDVITFGYASPAAAGAANGPLDGDLLICVDDALAQAEVFNRPWQEELARYATHGVLHLLGYDDLSGPARKVMKRKENELVARLAKKIGLNALEA